MRIDTYELGQVVDEDLKFAVIAASYNGKWVFVKHKKRETWEIPGGHREIGENINDTANRELFEETGAKKFKVTPVCDYSVTSDDVPSCGRLFYGCIEEMGELPEFEIGEIKLFNELPKELTYPGIQPYLYEETLKFYEKERIFGEKLNNVEYISRTGVYGIAYNNQGMIGVIKTPTGYFLPGGGLEKGESRQQCLEREFMEETGYEIAINNFIGKASLYHMTKTLQYMYGTGYFYTVTLNLKLNDGIEKDHSLIWMEPEKCIKSLFLQHQAWAVSRCQGHNI